MTAHQKVRSGAQSVLVPGISVFRDNLGPSRGSDPVQREAWIVQAVAQVDGRQQRRRLSLTRRPLREALVEACGWRALRVAGVDAGDLLANCWRALPHAVLAQMREDRVDVRRSVRSAQGDG